MNLDFYANVLNMSCLFCIYLDSIMLQVNQVADNIKCVSLFLNFIMQPILESYYLFIFQHFAYNLYSNECHDSLFISTSQFLYFHQYSIIKIKIMIHQSSNYMCAMVLFTYSIYPRKEQCFSLQVNLSESRSNQSPKFAPLIKAPNKQEEWQVQL